MTAGLFVCGQAVWRTVRPPRIRVVEYAEVLRQLSDELVDLQKPIRILNSISWSDDVRDRFFAAGEGAQPEVDQAYYATERKLAFDADELDGALASLADRVSNQLGDRAGGRLLTGRIGEYRSVLRLLTARGTRRFGQISGELYGRATDPVHIGGPTLTDLGSIMTEALANIAEGEWEPPESETVDAAEGVRILSERLSSMFGPENEVRVKVDDGIVADAAAGSDYIKLRADAGFTVRDLRVLEVHEGWVHVGTSLNGRRQPLCTFLGKGVPSTTVTQEGLAIFTEITTMSSTPDRLRRVTRRMEAIAMAEDGATFLDVYRWFGDQGLNRDMAWTSSVRVFRGSVPEGPPFTKDLVYSRGFLEVYNLIRLAVRRGLLNRIQMLFVGKLSIRELPLVADLADQGLIQPPDFLPPHIADLGALASWMAYSNILNEVDLDVVTLHLDEALSS